MTAVAATFAALMRPPLALSEAPPWLLGHQVGPFRQGVAAIERYGGVLMALRIGSGKTYVGLALGGHFAAGEVIDVIGPGILRTHWSRTAAAVGVAIRFSSFEAASRGQAPSGLGPVIIDESHRLRHPNTERYRVVAPALIGRRVILLSATPMVNRVTDLAAQLLLGIRDDALARQGVASIARQLEGGVVTAPFGSAIIVGEEDAGPRPARSARDIPDWSSGDPRFAALVRSIGQLRLARNGPVARLLRGSLFRALASSPAALVASLGRYRRLLDHAAAAHRAGHPVSRAMIRSVTEAAPEQLVFWEVLEPERLAADLALGDRRGLARLEREIRSQPAAADPKVAILQRIVADGQPTVLFTTSVDTLHYLRRQTFGHRAAWVTGSAAGIGWLRTSRSAVLDAFDPATSIPGIGPPVLLLASDVAAEGLNLRRAGRIIHYDLPWTAVRLDQRDGRAIRQGSAHTTVEVVSFRVPAVLEGRIGLEAAIARKRVLPVGVQLLGSGGQGPPLDGGADTRDRWVGIEGPNVVVAGFAVSDGAVPERGLVLIRRSAGPWFESGSEALLLLDQARAGRRIEIEPALVESIRRELKDVAADWVRRRHGACFSGGVIGPGALAVVEGRMREAVRRRSGEGVLAVERVLRFLGRGHTAGERMLVDRLAKGDDAAFIRAGDLAPSDQSTVTTATLVGLIVFAERGGSTTFPP